MPMNNNHRFLSVAWQIQKKAGKKNKKIALKVLVVCLDNWNTLAEIPFVLKKGGCTVTIFSSKDAWVKSNKFFDYWIERSENINEIQKQVIALGTSGQYDWILLGDETIIKLMNDCITDENTFKKILPLTKIENKKMLSSKYGLFTVCEQNGILSPKSIIADNGAFSKDEINQLNFPVVIKADFSWGGKGMHFCENASKLNESIKQATETSILIQQYIVGKEYPVEALFYKGLLLCYGVSEILTHDKDRFTYSTRRKYLSNTSIGNELKILGAKLGINGFANIAYIHSKANNQYYLIEADIRPTSWVAMGRFTYTDFSIAIKNLVKNQIALLKEPICMPEGKSIEVALFHKDLRRSFYKRDIKGIIRWILNYKGYWRFIPWYDRVLLKKIGSDLWTKLFSRFIKINR